MSDQPPEMTDLKTAEVLTGHVYDHDDHGEVVVASITASYDDWDVETGTTASPPDSPTVTFYSDWDAFGPLAFDPSAKHTATTREFAQAATYVREFTND